MSNSGSCNSCIDCPKRNARLQDSPETEIFQSQISGFKLEDKPADTRPKQSANCLFNFVSKFKYLEIILKDMCITPRYCEENIEYLGIDGISKIILPMRCFCDIPLNKLAEHVKIYGKYGIAFTREWGLRNKLQPVQYLNPNSEVTKQIASGLRLNKRISAKNYFGLKYIKPLTGKMKRKKEGIEKELDLCFEDEKEWRYIPEIKTKRPPAFIINNLANLNKLSDKLHNNKEINSLKFKAEDIKYLLVENEQCSKKLICLLEILRAMGSLTQDQTYDLISKILIFDKLEEDWG